MFLSLLFIFDLIQEAALMNSHVVFKHFQNLEYLYAERFKGKTAYLLPSKLLKQHSANSYD